MNATGVFRPLSRSYRRTVGPRFVETLATGDETWLDASMTTALAVEALTPVRVPSWLVAALQAWILRASGGALRGVTTAARHTGIPVVVVAALALVLAYRIARRAMHLVVEVALALALVLAATRAGWIRF
jgi:hypothetical protein